MTVRRSAMFVTALIVAAGVSLPFLWSNEHNLITGTAVEMDTTRKPIAEMRRSGSSMNISLIYFPSFESTFSQPKLTRDANGMANVLIESYSSGPFYRKGEQLTNLSFTLPSAQFRTGELVQIRSGDYEGVTVSVVAP